MSTTPSISPLYFHILHPTHIPYIHPYQGSTNGIRHIHIYMPNFIAIQMILDMHMLTCMLTFSQRISKFSDFFWFLLCYLFKNLLLYIWPLIYLFVLGRDSFFTVYIWFKETLFFNSSYKLLNKHFSLPQSTCQIRVPVRNKLK